MDILQIWMYVVVALALEREAEVGIRRLEVRVIFRWNEMVDRVPWLLYDDVIVLFDFLCQVERSYPIHHHPSTIQTQVIIASS